jgi:hypothetical protein
MMITPPSKRPGATLWICSWQRSGSTWLAEMLASARGTRLVYEPANLHDSTFTGEAAARIVPASGPGAAATDVINAIAGAMRGPWLDQLNRCHVVERSVVKDVRALGVAGVVAEQLPGTPIVILVRNPFAVARSVLELGWTSTDDADHAYLDEVNRWSEMHREALADPRLARARFLTYEALVRDPRREIQAIFDLAATYNPTWRGVDVDSIDTLRRSATEFRDASVHRHDVAPGQHVLDEAEAALARQQLPTGSYDTLDLGALAAELRDGDALR